MFDWPHPLNIIYSKRSANLERIECEMSMVSYEYGVHLEGTLLWFDPTRTREFAAVSSARVPLRDSQSKLLWGDRTARLVAAYSGRKSRGLVCPFHRPFSLGSLTIELFPSGYMAGAAQFLVTTADQHRLVYTGPFCMRRNHTAEAIEIRTCDTLVLDAGYGHESFRFPPRKTVYSQVIDWVDNCLGGGATPIILAANPGKAQDVIHLLGTKGYSLRVHRGIYAYNKAYQNIGIDMPRCRQFRGSPARGDVVIWPSHLRKSAAIRKVRKAHFAAMTGAGAQEGVARRLRVSTVFTWSNRADFDDLQTYVARAKPKRVITHGQYATELASILNRPGLSATPLITRPQLPLL